MKDILKTMKMNENNLSMVLGAVVVVIVGLFVVNYFRKVDTGEITTPAVTTESQKKELPALHTVQAGETLWSIAEDYYNSGYNWIDIQKENGLTNASVITSGQELRIPNVEAKLATATTVIEPASPVEATPSTPVSTPEAVVTAVTDSPTDAVTTAPSMPQDGTYTVTKGETLWSIAVKVYGNGYKWVDISRANNLKHPNIIHSGNVLTLPR